MLIAYFVKKDRMQNRPFRPYVVSGVLVTQPPKPVTEKTVIVHSGTYDRLVVLN